MNRSHTCCTICTAAPYQSPRLCCGLADQRYCFCACTVRIYWYRNIDIVNTEQKISYRSFMRLSAVWEPSRTTASNRLRPNACSRCRMASHSSPLNS